MVKRNILTVGTEDIAFRRPHVTSSASQQCNRLPSPHAQRVISMLCGLIFFSFGTAVANPNPPTNLCIEGAADCGVVPTSITEAKKWHPGHYMQISLGESDDQDQSLRFSFYDQIGDNTQIQGVVLRLKWGQLESTEGNYTFDTAQADLDYLKALPVPKRLFIRIHDRSYVKGGADCTNGNMFPVYLRNSTGCTETTNGNTARIWDSYVQDRLIALYEAMAARWDDEPFFEGVYLIRETAKNGSIINDSTFTDDGYLDGLKAIATGADAAFIRSNAVMSINYAGGTTRLGTLLAHMNTLGIGLGGPDILPTGICTSRSVDADTVFVGDVGGNDYRGAMPAMRSTEASNMTGSLGTCLPDQIRDFANDTLHASHLFWTRQNWSGDAARQWNTGVLPYINNTANDLTHISCPTNYTQGCEAN